MTRSPTPIALFAYNRPDHVQRALETLATCSRLDECRVFVYCDGPRDTDRGDAVEQTRRVVRQWASRLDARVVERSENLGLARSIVGGVTELCEEHGRVIVIEDDHQVSVDFIDYMLRALERYQNEPAVYQVSGYMFPVEHPPEPDAFFLPLTTTWGWATWDRAWRVFDWDAAGAVPCLADSATRYRFDLRDSYPYSRLLEDRLAGRNDSWGILWWWAVFQADGLVLHPRRSLVWNSGFDGSGTHCGCRGGDDAVLQADTLTFRFASPIAFPPKVVSDESAFERITRLLESQSPPRRSRDRGAREGAHTK